MCLLTFMVPSWTSASGFLLNEHGWNKRWQTDKTTNMRPNVQTLSSASLNMVQIENRPLQNTLQVLHMLSSTLSPFPLFASLTVPSEIAISKQMESLGQMGVKQIAEERERGTACIWISSRVWGSTVEADFTKESDIFRVDLLTSTQCLHLTWVCCVPDLEQRNTDNNLVIAHALSQNISKITRLNSIPITQTGSLTEFNTGKKKSKWQKSKWQDSPQKKRMMEQRKRSWAILSSNCPCAANTAEAQNMRERKKKKISAHACRCRTHTSILTRRDRKTRVWLKGVPLASDSLAMRHEGEGKWVSQSLWLVGEEQGEAWCAGWGLQTGGQSGGEVQSDFLGEYGVFVYEWSCWHVISLAVVTQGGTGAKVNRPALWKHSHQALQPREWTQRIMWETPKKIFISAGTENIGRSSWIRKMLKGQHLHATNWVELQLHHLIRGAKREKQTAVQVVETI